MHRFLLAALLVLALPAQAQVPAGFAEPQFSMPEFAVLGETHAEVNVTVNSYIVWGSVYYVNDDAWKPAALPGARIGNTNWTRGPVTASLRIPAADLADEPYLALIAFGCNQSQSGWLCSSANGIRAWELRLARLLPGRRGGLFQRMSDVQMANFTANLNHPQLDGIDFTVKWSEVNPAEGVYNWSPVLDPLNAWKSSGKKIRVGVVLVSPRGNVANAGHAVPQWVINRGAKIIRFNTTCDKKPTPDGFADYPVYWDTLFLSELGNFVRALSQRFDGEEGLDSVYACTGKTCGTEGIDDKAGEGCPDRSNEIYSQLLNAYIAEGYTRDRWLETVKKILDIYGKYFRRTPVTFMPGGRWFEENMGPDEWLVAQDYLNKSMGYAAAKGFDLYFQGLNGDKSVWRVDRSRLYNTAVKFSQLHSCATRTGLETSNPTVAGVTDMTVTNAGPIESAVDNAIGGLEWFEERSSTAIVYPRTYISYLTLYITDITLSNPYSPYYNSTWGSAIAYAKQNLVYGC